MNKIAVIDIGSNSIRLSIYQKPERILLPYFNEKVICALGLALDKNSNFTQEAQNNTIKILSRFIILVKALNIINLTIFATAAFRIAKNGQSFAEEINQKFNVNVKIISGEEEGILAAKGIFYAFPNSKGIVIDLGGGSVEIAYIANNNISQVYSWNVGLLSLKSARIRKIELMSYLKEKFNDIHDLYLNQNLFLIGGGFRYLAKLHIKLTKHPLEIIHNYQITAQSFLKILEILDQKPSKEIEKIIDNSSRISTIKESILLSKYLINLFSPKKIIFSAYGIREGSCFSSMNFEEQEIDPLIASCRNLTFENDIPQNEKLFLWVKQIFKCRSKAFDRIIKACCILFNIASQDHTEYKAESAFQKVMDSSIIGLTHKERVFMACCLFYRYKIKDKNHIMNNQLKIISKRMHKKAKLMGITLKLAQAFTAGVTSLLIHSHINIKDKFLTFEINKNFESLVSDSVAKYIKLLAKELNLKVSITLY